MANFSFVEVGYEWIHFLVTTPITRSNPMPFINLILVEFLIRNEYCNSKLD